MTDDDDMFAETSARGFLMGTMNAIFADTLVDPE